MDNDVKTRARQEIAYCEAILAKSGLRVLDRVLPKDGLLTWKHYPEPDVYDPVQGAQWYYHCHDDSAAQGEHGHFHCFVRPDGRQSPACHLVAIGVDAQSRPTRLFSVNQWVVGGQWHDAATTNALLGRFNVELATPDYLVNRWLTGLVALYEDEIAALNIERDTRLAAFDRPFSELLEDRSIEVLTQLPIPPSLL
ncbi:DUF6969 family protein [Aquamicrobium segne]|uniref:DUF6969 family protein n=1 Tax=Aquamicrobium segne TaxID=469547 RepID=A0ABW0H048_9HYPH